MWTSDEWHIVFIAHWTTYVGGIVLHSYGRLIPHEFHIIDLQQISGADGIGRITCTVSSGTARFHVNGRQTGGVTKTRNGATATLLVNPSDVDSFQNRGLYCPTTTGSYFYLFLTSASKYNIELHHYLKRTQHNRHTTHVDTTHDKAYILIWLHDMSLVK